MPTVRVLIADDDRRVRHALRNFLARVGGITVIGTAASSDTAFHMADERRPQVAIVDLLFPDVRDGLGLLEKITGDLRIPAIAISIEVGLRGPALAAGALTFIEKADVSERLVDAIREAGAARHRQAHRQQDLQGPG